MVYGYCRISRKTQKIERQVENILRVYPEAVKKLTVMDVNQVEQVAATVDFVFSAVDMTKDEIRAIEEAYAKTEPPVVSNNSAHRWTATRQLCLSSSARK